VVSGPTLLSVRKSTRAEAQRRTQVYSVLPQPPRSAALRVGSASLRATQFLVRYCAKQTQLPRRRAGRGKDRQDCRRCRPDRLYKQSQLGPATGMDESRQTVGQLPLGPIVLNKANAPQASGRASALWKRSYEGLDLREGLGKTKPIPGRSGLGKSRHGCQFRRWAPLYKQSQFADTATDGRGPAKSLAEPSRGPTAPNKANLRRIGRKGCRLPGAQVLPSPGANVRNKANFRTGSRRQGPARLPGPLAAPIVRNKANFHPSGRGAGSGIRPRMPATSRHSVVSQTLDGSGANEYRAGLSDVLWRWQAARLEPA
jgi:hypothetical protein